MKGWKRSSPEIPAGDGQWADNRASLNVGGATFDAGDGAICIDALSGDAAFVGGDSPVAEIGAAGGSGSFCGMIDASYGTLELIKTGAGIQILAVANNVSGGVDVENGTLQVANPSAPGLFRSSRDCEWRFSESQWLWYYGRIAQRLRGHDNHMLPRKRAR